jgi:hypothetical protein
MSGIEEPMVSVKASQMDLKIISLLMGFLVFSFAQVYRSEQVGARPAVSDKTQVSKAIADRFAEALQKRNYPFVRFSHLLCGEKPIGNRFN